jgi:hypothetical protein
MQAVGSKQPTNTPAIPDGETNPWSPKSATVEDGEDDPAAAAARAPPHQHASARRITATRRDEVIPQALQVPHLDPLITGTH